MLFSTLHLLTRPRTGSLVSVNIIRIFRGLIQTANIMYCDAFEAKAKWQKLFSFYTPALRPPITRPEISLRGGECVSGAQLRARWSTMRHCSSPLNERHITRADCYSVVSRDGGARAVAQFTFQ